ncbi:AAA family ATPase [Desulfocurvibacter africanus]|uniref:AAA family ATPase n=1 Tax=Desulfocurvibacter africanus TaxID=873 RepID=UPI001B7FE261|nr:AAA family ATPase [Desulfocurvibacter africanus]
MTHPFYDLRDLTVTDADAGAVFSAAPSGRMVKGYAAPCAYTPAPDPGYLFHEASRDIIVWFMNTSDPLYVFGPTGSGKTSAIKQLASRLNYPVFEITGHGRLEFPDLVGHLSLRQDNMEFQYGPLALAMKHGGLFLLNEIDLLDPATAAGLNGILDGEPLCIPENGGELITPSPMFRFAATGNTNGGSDETGLYQGTLRQNLAFLDRFWLCEMGYPAPEAEERLLESCAPILPEAIRKKMVEFANEVRRLFMGEAGAGYGSSIEVTFSTRTLIRWADLMVRFHPLARQGVQPVSYALDRALGYRATRETRAVLHELVQRIFPMSIGS